MTITHILERLRSHTHHMLSPPIGGPRVGEQHIIPKDVASFYARCGGATLFVGSDAEIRILSPAEVMLANPHIVGPIPEEEYESIKDDISWSWYTIAQNPNGEFITIDFHPLRLGRCYDSFWDRHAIAGSCDIVANSFTELMQNLINTPSWPPYWVRPEFQSLGDAYDDDTLEQ